jgi:hypothetical protein
MTLRSIMAAANTTTLEQARTAKANVAPLLAALPVVGVGGLKVNLSESVADIAVPKYIDGVPIKTEVVGAIRKR